MIDGQADRKGGGVLYAQELQVICFLLRISIFFKGWSIDQTYPDLPAEGHVLIRLQARKRMGGR